MQHRFESFVAGITECYRYIQRIKSVEMTELGLKGTHVMCLYYLGQSPEGLTVTKLAELCCEDKAAVSRTVAELEQLGHCCRYADGKKYRAPLCLTESGQQAAAKIGGLVEQWVMVGGDGLSNEERAAFYGTLAKIAANLKGAN